jgi:hypothetical protein
MRDNEKILQHIADTEALIKLRLWELIEADASPDTLRGFVECLQTLNSAACNLGERRFNSSEALYAIAEDVTTPIEKKLSDLIGRLEKYLEAHDG